MTDEYLEALDWMYDISCNIRNTTEEYTKVKQAITELKSIKEANPTEALDCINYIENKLGNLKYECEEKKNHRCDDLFIQEHIFATIKQYILKAQKQEKVLNELLMLINDLEPTFNRKGMVSMDDDNLGTFIKNYFIDNASDLLKVYLNKDKKEKQ